MLSAIRWSQIKLLVDRTVGREPPCLLVKTEKWAQGGAKSTGTQKSLIISIFAHEVDVFAPPQAGGGPDLRVWFENIRICVRKTCAFDSKIYLPLVRHRRIATFYR